MRRNEDYPSYYYKDIEGTAEIGLERSAGEPFRELKVYGESVQGENLFDTGTANDYKAYSIASGVLEVNGNTLTAACAGGFATHCIKETNYIPETYCISAIFSGSPRFIIHLYNDADELMDNTSVTISGWTYNKVYQGWYASSNCVVNIPEGVAYWRIGVGFYSGTTGEKVSVSNIKLYKAPSPDNSIKVESVGDRTPQLFNLPTEGEISWYANSSGLAPKGVRNPDGSITFDGVNGDDVVKNMQKIFGDSEKMIIEETGVYAFSCKNASSAIYMMCRLPNGSGGFAYQTINISSKIVYATIEQGTEITVYLQVGKNASVSNLTLYPMMQKVNAEGDAVADYEPYGYKVPVEVMNGDEIKETTVYLKEPLRKIGNYADEIDVIDEKTTRNIFEYTLTDKCVWGAPERELDTTIRSYSNYENIPRVRSDSGMIGFSEKGVFTGATTYGNDFECCQFSNNTDTNSVFFARILKSRCADPENPAKSDFTNIYTPGTKVYGVRETPIEEPILLSDEIKTLKRNCQLRVKTSLSPSKVKAQYYRY